MFSYLSYHLNLSFRFLILTVLMTPLTTYSETPIVVGLPSTPTSTSHSELAVPQPKFTDMHTHVACLSSQDLERIQEFPGEDCYVSPEMKNNFKFEIYLKALDVTKKEFKAIGNFAVFDKLAAKIKNSTRVRRSVVLGLDGWVDPVTGLLDKGKTPTYVPNAFVLAGVRRWQKEGLFFYGPSINPNRKDAIERLEQAGKDGAVLIKWIPSTMNIDPDDSRFKPFYEKMKALGLPLLVHTGKENTFLHAENQLSDPMRLKLPLDLGLTVIAAHVATDGSNQGQTDFNRLGKLFADPKYRELLFADISATTQFNRVKHFPTFIKNPDFQGRLLYGTDWPLIDARVFGKSFIPFEWYSTFFFNLLTGDQIKELKKIVNTFDQDVRLKEMLGAHEELFKKADEVLKLAD